MEKHILRLYMAAAGDSSLLIAETADVYDRRSGVIVRKGLGNQTGVQLELEGYVCYFTPILFPLAIQVGCGHLSSLEHYVLFLMLKLSLMSINKQSKSEVT